MASDKAQDCAKAKAILKVMKEFKFVAHLLFFVTLLLLHFCYTTFCDMAERGYSHAHYLTQCEANENVSFKGIILNRPLQNMSPLLTKFQSSNVLEVDKHLAARLNLEDEQVFNTAKILDTRLCWPYNTPDVLETYGNEEVEHAASHFKKLLNPGEDDGLPFDNLICEWQQTKKFVCSNLQGVSPQEVIQKLLLLITQTPFHELLDC